MATGYEHLELDRQLCFALYRAGRAAVRAYGPLLAEAGITYPQYLTLLVLWERSEEALTVGALGARLELDSATLTPLLKRLEALGLVTRRRDPADERRVLVRPTAESLTLRERLSGVPGALFDGLGLSTDEARRLRDLLARVG